MKNVELLAANGLAALSFGWQDASWMGTKVGSDE